MDYLVKMHWNQSSCVYKVDYIEKHNQILKQIQKQWNPRDKENVKATKIKYYSEIASGNNKYKR